MNPFDAPPSTPPVSLESPADPPAPRRGRMALVAVASTGLLAAGVIGVSALATADDPPLDPVDAAADAMLSATVDGDTDEGDAPAPDENVNGDDRDDGTDGSGDEPSLDGEIRIETGDGDPIVIDLGELGPLDGEAWERFRECADLPMWLGGDLGGGLGGELDLTWGDALDDAEFEAQFDELFGEFESMFDDFPAELDVWLDGWLDDSGLLDGSVLEQEFGDGPILGGPGVLADGGAVTVLGPDGVTIIDLGDGDGSVTVTRDGDTGELTITTDGTATEQQLDDLFGDLPVFDGEFEFPEFDGDFEFPALPELEGLDPERINDCLSELG